MFNAQVAHAFEYAYNDDLEDSYAKTSDEEGEISENRHFIFDCVCFHGILEMRILILLFYRMIS